MEMVEKAVAKSLMDIKAVMLRPEQPFTWASGWFSPIYCDNRRILSYPEIRENVCRWMADIVKKQYPDVEVIAGVATGAIAHGYLVAHFLGKPFCYVRPKPKDHGTGSQIEGILPEGAKVEWTASNGCFNVSVDAEGNLKAISNSSGDTTFTAKVKLADGTYMTDMYGNEVVSTTTVKSNAGFFQKLIGFFKGLFGLTKIHE